MNISDKTYELLEKQIPNLKLYNESFLHNKVSLYTEYLRIIPKGKKAFLWFKRYNNNNLTYLLETKHNKIMNIYQYKSCFHKYLTNGIGTILYGTYTQYNNKNVFIIEDISYYKGIDITHESLYTKLNLYADLLQYNIQQVAYTKYDILVTPTYLKLVNSHLDNNKLSNIINTINKPIPIYSIQLIKNNKIYKVLYSKLHTEYIHYYYIKAKIQNDIYVVLNKDKQEVSTASIPSYTISCLMNKHFRNIRENTNLDNLEESDDEDDFENINENKFVFLDKMKVFKCMYNKKDKSWIPVEYVCEENETTKYKVIIS